MNSYEQCRLTLNIYAFWFSLMTEWLIFLMAGIKYIISISLSAKWWQENVNKQPLENNYPVGKRIEWTGKIPIFLMVLCTQGNCFSLCVLIISLWVFCGQENEGQVWWHGIFVTKAHRQWNSKNPQEKNDGQINISLSFYPWRLFPVGVYTGKLFFNFSVGILYFSVGMCTPLREIPVSSSGKKFNLLKRFLEYTTI